MSSSLAVSTTPEAFDADEAAAFEAVVPFATDAATLFSSWPVPVEQPPLRLREFWAVLAVSAVLHAGFAAATFRPSSGAHAPKRLSRVEVELARPPEPPKPLTKPVVPPPPPKVVKQDVKPLAAPPPPTPVDSPATPEPTSLSTDTGSSAAAAEDGELHAGTGGLGTAAPAPPPPAPAPPAPVAEPVVQAREGANYLKNPRPAYPRRAKRERLEGTTLLRVQVQPSGKPAAVKVQKSSGHELLDEAALESVAQWTFAPATQGGTPVAGSVLVPIVFRLQ